VFVPAQPAGATLAAYKVTKRLDEDITATLGAFRLVRDGDRVTEARLAFGGMAATPKRAARAEAALVGQPWSEAAAIAAGAALAEDFTPITDWRASSDYRATVARNLMRRFFLDADGGGAQLVREAVA
jgi:xanthine dehydrogenase small subunit